MAAKRQKSEEDEVPYIPNLCLHVFVLGKDENFVFQLLAVLKGNSVQYECLAQPRNGYFRLNGRIFKLDTITHCTIESPVYL